MIRVELVSGRVDTYPDAHAWAADEDGHLTIKAVVHKPVAHVTYAAGQWVRVGPDVAAHPGA